MPRRHVSRDVKERIPYLRYSGFSVKEIGRILGVKKSMIYQTLNYHRNHRVTYNPTAFSNLPNGRPRILKIDDLNLVRSLLSQYPSIYLDELQDELFVRRGVAISIPTLFRSLRRIHFSRKSVSVHALERNDLDRSMYMNRFADLVLDPAMVMFVDEAARNKKNPSRKMGWSLEGRRCIQRRCFVRGQRFSILPVLMLDGIIAHEIFPGSVTSEIFARFLRDHVVGSNFHDSFVATVTLLVFLRFHLQTLTRVHGVSLFLTTAIFIIPKLSVSLLRMKLVSDFPSHLHEIHFGISEQIKAVKSYFFHHIHQT